MRAVRRVAVLIDQEQRVDDDPNLVTDEARQHAPAEYHLAAALRRLRYDVNLIACLNARQIIADLERSAPDVVFNLTEHMNKRRVDDIQIPVLLEMFGFAYTGATAASLLLCRDKAVSKCLASMAGVRVPEFALAPRGERIPDHLPPFPLVVKPLTEDSSEGIGMTSVVHSRRTLETRIATIHRRLLPAIVESFIAGSDVYVFVLRGRAFQIMPPVELCIDADASSPRSMATYHVKHDDAYREKWKVYSRPARLRARHELAQTVRALWSVLQLRDYCRFDFRMTGEGDLYFIEANPNPAFSPGGRYDRWDGPEFDAAVKLLITNAARRRTR